MAGTLDKREAQKRVDRIHAFRQQLEELLREGVLDLAAEQRLRLDAHLDRTLTELAERFDVDVSAQQKRLSLGMRILSALGGLAFCAALFFFFYRYWGALSTPLQVGLLIGTPLLGLGALEVLARRDKTLYYTSLLGVVVLASFILNLSVLGVLFNIASSPAAELAWGAFAFILAYAYGLHLPLAAALIFTALWAAGTVTTWSGGVWYGFFERPETLFPAGLAAVLAPALWQHRKHAGFPPIYRLVGLLLILIPLFVLMHAPQLSYLPLSTHILQGVYQVAAFASAGVVIWLGIRRNDTGFVNLGSAFFTLSLFDRLFTWWWDWMPKYVFFLVIGLIALVLLVLFRGLRSRMPEGSK